MINYSKINCEFVPTLPVRENLIQIYNPKFTIHLRNSQTLVNRFFHPVQEITSQRKLNAIWNDLLKTANYPGSYQKSCSAGAILFWYFRAIFAVSEIRRRFLLEIKIGDRRMKSLKCVGRLKKELLKTWIWEFSSFLESSSIELLDFNNLSQVILPDCLESNCECKFTSFSVNVKTWCR